MGAAAAMAGSAAPTAPDLIGLFGDEGTRTGSHTTVHVSVRPALAGRLRKAVAGNPVAAIVDQLL